jgi:predicted transposase YdaD
MTTHSDSDSAWKQILEIYLKDFIDYCLPKLSQLIDWERKWTSLDKELQAITKGTSHGKRLVDKLFKVHLKDGKEQWILIHLEIQAKQEKQFSERMFIYAYRIYDKYRKLIFSCAILTDESKKWRPNYFELSLAGSRLSSEFTVIKLIDYRLKLAQLEESTNPFASVILVQLKAIDAKRQSDEQKKNVKYLLTKRLYEKGFDKKQVIDLYQFIDWMISLPESFELEYLNEVYELEEVKKMPYISTAERLGMKKGREEGIKEGMEIGMEKGLERGMEKGMEKGIKKVALNLIEQDTDVTFIAKVTGLKLAEINRLKEESKH